MNPQILQQIMAMLSQGGGQQNQNRFMGQIPGIVSGAMNQVKNMMPNQGVGNNFGDFLGRVPGMIADATHNFMPPQPNNSFTQPPGQMTNMPMPPTTQQQGQQSILPQGNQQQQPTQSLNNWRGFGRNPSFGMNGS